MSETQSILLNTSKFKELQMKFHDKGPQIFKKSRSRLQTLGQKGDMKHTEDPQF